MGLPLEIIGWLASGTNSLFQIALTLDNESPAESHGKQRRQVAPGRSTGVRLLLNNLPSDKKQPPEIITHLTTYNQNSTIQAQGTGGNENANEEICASKFASCCEAASPDKAARSSMEATKPRVELELDTPMKKRIKEQGT